MGITIPGKIADFRGQCIESIKMKEEGIHIHCRRDKRFCMRREIHGKPSTRITKLCAIKESMDIELIVALIGLAGIVMSALVQFCLGRKSEENKKAAEIRANAYVDLLNIVSEIAGSAKHNEKRRIEQLQQLTQAKTRVILIGSDEVVKAVHSHFKEYDILNSEESTLSFSCIVGAMRKDLSGKNTLQNSMLNEALFANK